MLLQPFSLIKYPPDYAITHGLTPFISMQNHYNLLYREEEREMVPTLKVRYLIINAIYMDLMIRRSSYSG